jgi:hypothetical protein
MNALLGLRNFQLGFCRQRESSPPLPIGESERVLLQREGWIFPQEIRLDQLAEYVTQHGNPGWV